MARREPGEPYYRVSVDEAKAVLDRGDDAVVVDVRTAEEYTGGHIQGALWVPVDEVLTRINELPQGKKLLFICQSGVRSGLAAEMAAAMGFDQELLYNIEDGTPAWVEKGYPTSYGMDK